MKRNNYTTDDKQIQGLPSAKDRKIFQLQCFPLYSILRAVGRVDIDFLSLDIEGGEISVLESILKDCNDFKFNIATIERVHMDLPTSKKSFMEFDYMMKSMGYHSFSHLRHDVQYENRNNNK